MKTKTLKSKKMLFTLKERQSIIKHNGKFGFEIPEESLLVVRNYNMLKIKTFVPRLFKKSFNKILIKNRN